MVIGDIWGILTGEITAFFAALLIVLFLFFIVRKQKGKAVRREAYLCIDSFLRSCHKLNFYDASDDRLTKYKPFYEELTRTKTSWYYANPSRRFIDKFVTWFEAVDRFRENMSQFMDEDHYFAHSEYVSATEGIAIDKLTRSFLTREFMDYVRKKVPHSLPCIGEYEKELDRDFSDIPKMHNEIFIEKELRCNKGFFDTVLKYPLDEQQRESIVKLEDNCLVISSAGSGKTSTSIAKVRYLLEKRKMSDDEILVLSFNRKTAEEFRERLGVPGLTCKTFHALARSIVGEAEGRMPDVCEPTFLLTCYYNLVQRDLHFKAAINRFVSEVSSLTKSEHEYETGEEYYRDRATYGIMSPYGDMNGSPIYTRSEEEKKLCIWLSSHGVDFLYEQPYPFDSANVRHRQYKPDFTIYFKRDGKEYYLFLEHFGIDRNGNVPRWFGEGNGGWLKANSEYNDGILWKRGLHRRNNTLLLETTSAMFHDGTVYNCLERQLRAAGVPLRLLTEDEKYDRMIRRNKAVEESIMNLFSSFISLMKSNGKTFEIIMNDVRNAHQGQDFEERSRYLMYEMIKPLYDEYERTLREKGQMDFTDIVLRASEICASGKYKSPYRYILVDEFQDISVDRYKLILSLRQKMPLTKTYCVGDDWQSIYRFSGSDMNLFNHFEEYFGYAERCKIETTYRFGNPLVNRSSEFILKNPNQVAKEVRPLSESNGTKLSFVPFERGDSNREYLAKIKEIVDAIPANQTVMLLARYNYDVNVFPRSSREEQPNSRKVKVTFAGREMDFLSVHAAKGLEADHVIILYCSSDRGGFPSRITDDPILGFVLSKIDTFEFSEERRLFYVAITRARKHTYVMYNKDMPSVFVAEMELQGGSGSLICPCCRRGQLKVIKEAIASNKKNYRNYRCSNLVAGCDFFWRVFYESENDIYFAYTREFGRTIERRNPPISTMMPSMVPVVPIANNVVGNGRNVTFPNIQPDDDSSMDDLPF